MLLLDIQSIEEDEDPIAEVDVSEEDDSMFGETLKEEVDGGIVALHFLMCSLKHFLWKNLPHLSQREGAALYLNILLQD